MTEIEDLPVKTEVIFISRMAHGTTPRHIVKVKEHIIIEHGAKKIKRLAKSILFPNS